MKKSFYKIDTWTVVVVLMEVAAANAQVKVLKLCLFVTDGEDNIS
jgi:hypothetical protein